jgi:hypothetical protein
MNQEEIRQEIENRISEINETLPKLSPFYNKAIVNDIEKLEKLEKMVAIWKKSNSIFLIFLMAVLLIALLILKYFKGVNSVESFRIGLEILLISGFVRSGFRLCKLKSTLENKIYLLKLLGKIEIN